MQTHLFPVGLTLFALIVATSVASAKKGGSYLRRMEEGGETGQGDRKGQ